ncbi:MAG: cation:proton antiporter, partial [Bacteroidaceae bacterium]|nr:cation:proton antiporter [Bacteroidaceae bacterium]
MRFGAQTHPIWTTKPIILDVITTYLPITDPTWIFLLVLCVILFAPMIFSKLHIPHIIGMILAGVLIGEHGFNILARDASFELFGKVGIYFIMFLAGLEMNLQNLKQNRTKGLIFGVITTFFPFVLGLVAGYYFLHYSFLASLLLACIFASHTLVAYPIVGRYGLSNSPSVTISVAATMVALLSA